MAVISTEKDTDALHFRLVAEFDAGTERVWRIWADRTQLQRWWGPPTWPATLSNPSCGVRPSGCWPTWRCWPNWSGFVWIRRW